MKLDLQSLSAEPLIYMLMHSGAFVTVLGMVFFFIGLLFGRATWGRYKRQTRDLRSEAAAMKEEIADLKRKLGEFSVKPGPAVSIVTETIAMPPREPAAATPDAAAHAPGGPPPKAKTTTEKTEAPAAMGAAASAKAAPASSTAAPARPGAGPAGGNVIKSKTSAEKQNAETPSAAAPPPAASAPASAAAESSPAATPAPAAAASPAQDASKSPAAAADDHDEGRAAATPAADPGSPNATAAPAAAPAHAALVAPAAPAGQAPAQLQPQPQPQPHSFTPAAGGSPQPAAEAGRPASALASIITHAHVPLADLKAADMSEIPTLPEIPLPAGAAPPPQAEVKPEMHPRLGLIYTARPAEVDDLTAMKGVARALEQRLHVLGVYTYEQIASWTKEQVREFSARLAFKDRIDREHWVDQAKVLLAKKNKKAKASAD